MEQGGKIKLSPAKEAAYIAVMCALLLGGQYVFSFVVGVEMVTLLFVCFASVFGARRGVILAVSFSVLRCFIYGFTPAVLALYLIYYPALAAVFGGLGRLKNPTFGGISFAVIVNVVLTIICGFCACCYALDLIKISRLYKITVEVLLWVIFSLCAVLLVAFDSLLILRKFKKGNSDLLKVIAFAAIAAVCTMFFTLLDDAISPLFYGMGKLSATAYFYSSFTAMLPQTVCTIVTVTTLFLPLTGVFRRFFFPRGGKNILKL